MDTKAHPQRQEPQTTARAVARSRARALGRKRRLKEALHQIVRLANAIDHELTLRVQPVPEVSLDHLSTAQVSLETCFRRLTQSPNGTP